MRRRRRIHRPRLALAGLGLVALTLLLPASVLGHSELESADPPANSTVTESPSLIVANFTEAVDPGRSSMELRGPDGAVIANGGVAPGDPEAVQMTITPPALGIGTYEVRWTTVTPDDNGIERGTYTITVAAPPTAPPGTPVVPPSAPASAGASASVAASVSPASSATPSAAASAPGSAVASVTGPDGGSGGGSGDSGPSALVIVAVVLVFAIVVAAAVALVARGRRA